MSLKATQGFMSLITQPSLPDRLHFLPFAFNTPPQGGGHFELHASIFSRIADEWLNVERWPEQYAHSVSHILYKSQVQTILAMDMRVYYHRLAWRFVHFPHCTWSMNNSFAGLGTSLYSRSQCNWFDGLWTCLEHATLASDTTWTQVALVISCKCARP